MRRARWVLPLVPLVLVLVLAGCGSGSGGTGGGNASQSATATLEKADSTVQSALTSYLAEAGDCAKQSDSVVCLEAADRKLGNAVHTYANLLAVGHGFTAPRTDLTTARDAAQTLANSLEILGDAQPTQANYDQVLNTFNVNSAISELQENVTILGRSLGR
jgi:hypothetical protein